MAPFPEGRLDEDRTNGMMIRCRSSLDVSGQLLWRDGISDGIRVTLRSRAYTGQAFAAGLNIIARYVERMLSANLDGQTALK